MKAVDLQHLLMKVESLGDLPTLPEVVHAIRKVAADDHASAADLAAVILKDAALSGKVLRLVNSTFYRQQSGRISTVSRAIVILGFNPVQDLAMGLKVQEILAGLGDRSRLRSFWTVALASAICTRELALRAGHPNPEEPFVAALLQDVGQLVLEQCCPGEYAQVAEADRIWGRLAIEQERLGLDHAQVGAALARRWNLPAVLESAILHHHRQGLPPAQRHHLPVTDLVYVGHLLAAHVIAPGPEGESAERLRIASAAEHLLGAGLEPVRAILKALPEHLEELASRLEVSVAIPGSTQAAGRGAARDRGGADELAVLQEISTAIVHGSELEPLLRFIVDGAWRATGLERVVLLMPDDRGDLRGLAGIGLPEGMEAADLAVALREAGPLREFLVKGLPALLKGAEGLPASLAEALSPKDCVLAPLAQGGRLRGLVYADHGGKAVREEAVRSLGAFANQATIAIAMHGG